jgi:hypothetical protein
LSLQQITYLIAAVGLLGAVMVAFGIYGIISARRKSPAADGAGDRGSNGRDRGPKIGRQPVPDGRARVSVAPVGTEKYSGQRRPSDRPDDDNGSVRGPRSPGGVYGGESSGGGVYGGGKPSGPPPRGGVYGGGPRSGVYGGGGYVGDRGGRPHTGTGGSLNGMDDERGGGYEQGRPRRGGYRDHG